MVVYLLFTTCVLRIAQTLLIAAVYSTATELPEPDQSPGAAALRAHTASYTTAVTHNAAPPPPSTYLAAASTSSSSGGSRRGGSAADMVLAAIQTTRQRAHAKMAGRTRQVGAGRNMSTCLLHCRADAAELSMIQLRFAALPVCVPGTCVLLIALPSTFWHHQQVLLAASPSAQLQLSGLQKLLLAQFACCGCCAIGCRLLRRAAAARLMLRGARQTTPAHGTMEQTNEALLVAAHGLLVLPVSARGAL
jgi:hypothetical protein